MCRVKRFKESAGKARYILTEEVAALCQKFGARYGEWVRLVILTGVRQLAMGARRYGMRRLDPADHQGRWVQYFRRNDEAKALLKSLTPGNKSVCVFPSENPATHADPRNFYRRN